MKNVILIFGLAAMCLFVSCDKKKTTPDPIPPSTITGPVLGQAYSSLQANCGVTNFNNVIIKDSSLFASFFQSPPTQSTIPPFINAGNVTLNSTSLTIHANNQYHKTTGVPNLHGSLNWSVAGSGTLTAFTHSYNASFPNYNGANLPDTCVKANGINLNISNAGNFTGSGFTVLLSQNAATIYKFTLGNGGTVNFSTAELANFTVNMPISMQVSYTNYTTASYGGITHGFSNVFSYTKVSYLK